MVAIIMPPAVAFGFYHGYTASWLGYYEPPRVYQYDIYISETNLYELTKNQSLWSGTVKTADPGNINEEINRYVDQVIAALKILKTFTLRRSRP